MRYAQLSPELPLGPFADAAVTVWSTPEKTSKFHCHERCSRIRSGRLEASRVPLSVVLGRVCPQCARYGPWGPQGTGVGMFLEAMTGMGLLFELGRYAGADEDTLADEDVRRASALLNRHPRPGRGSGERAGEEDEDDERDWDACQEARRVRERIFEEWRGAAASLHRAHRLLSPFGFLSAWAANAMEQKGAHVARLQRQARELVCEEALQAAAGAGVMNTPGLPAQAPELAPLGPTPTVSKHLDALWRRWHHKASASWNHPQRHSHVVYHMTDEMRGRRKGRDDVLEYARGLVSSWAEAAEAAGHAEGPEEELLARLPEQREYKILEVDGRFLSQLSEWEWGVLAVWAADMDWARLTARLRVPAPVAARLLARGSVLVCCHAEEAGEDRVREPELAVEPGVFDGPVADRSPVTPAHLRALRALSGGADQLYLVLSAQHGPKVMALSLLERQVEGGDMCAVVAAADDVPAQPLTETVGAAQHDEAEIWSGRAHEPDHPDFGRSLGLAEGERVVRRLRNSFDGDGAADAALRSLTLARGVEDLRELEGTWDDITGCRRAAFHRDVWHGLLASEQLCLEPFEQDLNERPQNLPGLPLGVLGQVQVYSTDALGAFQGRAHSPWCTHQRHDRGLTRDYDLVTVARMLEAERFDPCSKCGGYVPRRLSDTQVAYYRAAHQVDVLARSVHWALRHSERGPETSRLAAEAKWWSDTPPEENWFTSTVEQRQWRLFTDTLHQAMRAQG